MSHMLTVNAPYLFYNDSIIRLILNSKNLIGDPHHFIRVELYPKTAPSTKKRQYGFWDIPTAEITKEKLELKCQFEAGKLWMITQKGMKEITRSWIGMKYETGYGVMHFTIWDESVNPPCIKDTTEIPIFLTEGAIQSSLKQIHIPVTERCNLECLMCPRNKSTELTYKDMTDEVLKPLLEEVPNVPCIMLMALGEPLLYPGIIDLVKHVKKIISPYAEVGMTTNATLLDKEMATGLIDAGINFIYCSVDGASRPVYEKIRRGASFDQVTDNIKFCSEYRNAKSASCRIMMNFVIQDSNVHEIADYVELAGRLGVENITYSFLHGTGSDELNTFGVRKMEKAFGKAMETAGKYNINLGMPALRKRSVQRCFCMERVVLSSAGEVYPCPQLEPGYSKDGYTRSFGNVKEKRLIDIWNHDDYRGFRHNVLTGNFPPECTNCGFKTYHVP